MCARGFSPYGSHCPPSVPGFDNPAKNTSTCYREVLLALCHPGRVRQLHGHSLPWSPAPLEPSMAAIAMTFAEKNVSIWLSPMLNTDEIRYYLHVHTQCSFVENQRNADLSLVGTPEELPHLLTFLHNKPAFSCSSITILLGGLEFLFNKTPDYFVVGAGTEAPVPFFCKGLPEDFAEQRRAFMGRTEEDIDVILLSGTRFIALPWGTRLEEASRHLH